MEYSSLLLGKKETVITIVEINSCFKWRKQTECIYVIICTYGIKWGNSVLNM